MAIAERELKQPKVLTYEDYLTEGETPGRYEIVDGVRTWMTGTSPEHNDIADIFVALFLDYQRSAGGGRKLSSPLDIITRLNPLKVRQPDASLISWERWNDRNRRVSSPLAQPPELVVEVLSPSETRRSIAAKMREYAGVGVKECWLVRPIETTIEAWELSVEAEPKLIATYGPGETFRSISFPDLSVDVAKIFEY